MPTLSFSKTRIEALEGNGKRVRYADDRTPYLMLYVTAQGAKAFYYYRKHKGKVVEVKLGAFPATTVFVAKALAEQMSARLAQGLAAQEAAPEIASAPAEAMTFGGLFERYLAEYAKSAKRSWREDEAQYCRYLKEWQALPIDEIGPELVTATVMKLRVRAPVAANRLLALVRKVFNFAIQQLDLEIRNPARQTKMTREEPRRRYLGEAEAGRLLATLESLAAGYEAGEQAATAETRDWPFWRDFFEVLLFTGARRSVVQAMAWTELRLNDGVWVVPAAKMKGKRDAVIVLPGPALVALARRPRTGMYVFPGRSGDVPVAEVKGAWSVLCQRAGLTDVRPHDLRRTFGTWQLQGGAALTTVRDSLSQSDVRVTQAAYAHVASTTIRDSVEQTAKRLVAAGKKG